MGMTVENVPSSSKINNMKSVFWLYILDTIGERSGAIFRRTMSAHQVPAIRGGNEEHSGFSNRSIASFYSTIGAVEVS